MKLGGPDVAEACFEREKAVFHGNAGVGEATELLARATQEAACSDGAYHSVLATAGGWGALKGLWEGGRVWGKAASRRVGLR